MKKQAKRILSWLGLLALLTGMALSVPAESGTDAAEEVYRQEIPASAFADEYMSYGEDGSMELLVNEAQCLLMLEDRPTVAAGAHRCHRGSAGIQKHGGGDPGSSAHPLLCR